MAHIFSKRRVWPWTWSLLSLLSLASQAISASASASQEISEITRDYHGDIFTVAPGECVNSNSICDQNGRSAAAVPGHECKCQCAPDYQTFREDLMECVSEITDCPMMSFVRPYISEKIPVVSLPMTGHLVHPGAHLTLTDSSGVEELESVYSSCEVFSAELMTQFGWQTLDNEEMLVFELAVEGKDNRTFLRWLGSDITRRQLQQRLVLVHFSCSSVEDPDVQMNPMPCAAMRIGWVPGVVSSKTLAGPATTVRSSSKSDRQNYLIIGLSLGVLGLMYVMAFMIYLRTKSASRRKSRSNSSVSKLSSSPQTQTSCVERAEEESFSDGEPMSIESEKVAAFFNHGLVLNDEELGQHQGCSSSRGGGGGGKIGFSAKFTPNGSSATESGPSFDSKNKAESGPSSMHQREKASRDDSGLASTIGESDQANQSHHLKINPSLFEPQYLAEPPAPALEFLKRIRDMIAAARCRIRNFRFKPTLLVIPEDDYFYHDIRESVYSSSGPERLSRPSVIIDVPDEMAPPVPPPRQTRKQRHQVTPMVSRKLPDNGHGGSSKACLSRGEIFTISERMDKLSGAKSALSEAVEATKASKNHDQRGGPVKVEAALNSPADLDCRHPRRAAATTTTTSAAVAAGPPAHAAHAHDQATKRATHDNYRMNLEYALDRVGGHPGLSRPGDVESMKQSDKGFKCPRQATVNGKIDDGRSLQSNPTNGLTTGNERNQKLPLESPSNVNGNAKNDTLKQEINDFINSSSWKNRQRKLSGVSECGTESKKEDLLCVTSSQNDEPSDATLERLSKRVAMKLNERRVPSVADESDERESKQQQQQPFFQLMKDFKNSIGRIGGSKQHPTKPAMSVFENNEGNWKLQTALEAAIQEQSRSALVEKNNSNKSEKDEDEDEGVEIQEQVQIEIECPGQADREKPRGEVVVQVEEPERDEASSSRGFELSALNYQPRSLLLNGASHYTRNNKVSEKQRKKYQKMSKLKGNTNNGSTSCNSADCPSDAESLMSGCETDQGTSTDAWSLSSFEVSTTSTLKKEVDYSCSDSESMMSSTTVATEDSLNTSCSQRAEKRFHEKDNSDERFTEDEDDNNAIEACLARLANATLETDTEATFRTVGMDRATKGLAALHKIQSANWRHVCRKRDDTCADNVRHRLQNKKEHQLRTSALSTSTGAYCSDTDNASTVTVSSIAFCRSNMLGDVRLSMEPLPMVNYDSHPPLLDTAAQSDASRSNTLTSVRSGGSQKLQRRSALNIRHKKPGNYISNRKTLGINYSVETDEEEPVGTRTVLSGLHEHGSWSDDSQDNGVGVDFSNGESVRVAGHGTNTTSPALKSVTQNQSSSAVIVGNHKQLASQRNCSAAETGSFSSSRLPWNKSSLWASQPSDNESEQEEEEEEEDLEEEDEVEDGGEALRPHNSTFIEIPGNGEPAQHFVTRIPV